MLCDELTNWGRDQMAAIFHTFLIHFLEWIYMNFSWLVYWRIYASPGLSEVKVSPMFYITRGNAVCNDMLFWTVLKRATIVLSSEYIPFAFRMTSVQTMKFTHASMNRHWVNITYITAMKMTWSANIAFIKRFVACTVYLATHVITRSGIVLPERV